MASNTTKRSTRNTLSKQAVEIIENIKELFGYDLFDMNDYSSFVNYAKNTNFNKAENEKQFESMKDELETLRELLNENKNPLNGSLRNVNENNNSY